VVTAYNVDKPIFKIVMGRKGSPPYLKWWQNFEGHIG